MYMCIHGNVFLRLIPFGLLKYSNQPDLLKYMHFKLILCKDYFLSKINYKEIKLVVKACLLVIELCSVVLNEIYKTVAAFYTSRFFLQQIDLCLTTF